MVMFSGRNFQFQSSVTVIGNAIGVRLFLTQRSVLLSFKKTKEREEGEGAMT